MAYREQTPMHTKIKNKAFDWVSDSGIMNNAFPMTFENNSVKTFPLKGGLDEISENKKNVFNSKDRPFLNAGVMIDRQVTTGIGVAQYSGKFQNLGDILLKEDKVPSEFFISSQELENWTYLKGSKKEERTTKTGFEYKYSEGPVTFPDALDRASRTIVTGEGGRGASRFKHVVKTKSGKHRRLTPVELERLNQFPDNHTKEASDNKRAFFMGNALVVGVVEKLGKSLAKRDGL